MRVLQDRTFSVMSLNSLVEGNIKPGAFLNEREYLDEKFDYTKLGVKYMRLILTVISLKAH